MKLFIFNEKNQTMKPLLLVFVLMFLLTSCDWFDFGKKSDDSSSIGGSTNIAVNTIGNTFSSSVLIGTIPFPTNSTIAVTKVDGDGNATVNIEAKLPSVPAAALIATKFKDASGNLNYDMKVKMTDEGLLDYTNIDHKPFVLVRYDAAVGDKYTLDLSDGTTITREVVKKSTADDYAWGGMLIKTINVEQSSTVPGIKKIEYITNHKFSIVGVKFYMEDGTILKIDLSSMKY